MSAPTAEGLLKAAADLIPLGRGRPPVAHLRRAISTAYYAAFCALCVEVGRAYPSPLNLLSRRLVSHAAATDVLSNLGKRDANGVSRLIWLPDRPACNPELKRFARSFLLLRDERERADYDHGWVHTKKDAEDAVALARLAISDLEQARQSTPQQVTAVCLAVIADPRSRKRLKLR